MSLPTEQIIVAGFILAFAIHALAVGVKCIFRSVGSSHDDLGL